MGHRDPSTRPRMLKAWSLSAQGRHGAWSQELMDPRMPAALGCLKVTRSANGTCLGPLSSSASGGFQV